MNGTRELAVLRIGLNKSYLIDSRPKEEMKVLWEKKCKILLIKDIDKGIDQRQEWKLSNLWNHLIKRIVEVLILAQQQAASSVKALILRAFFTSLEQHKSKLLIKCKHLKLL